jgi:predicted glycoside hydrolase/deacetylase ChbG (UPF0249 family)
VIAAAPRRVIVNADDFGQSHGVNEGIAAAHECGVVTSASLMVRWDAVGEASRYARGHADLSVGLHLDLGEWVFRDGSWVALYQVAPRDDAALLDAEIAGQLGRFRELMGRDPSHLDSHQHVHNAEPIRSLLEAIGSDLDVPVRSCNPEIVYSDRFYGQLLKGEPFPEGITPDRLIEILASLAPGITEIGCHPGLGTDIRSMYRTERAIEVDTLCDPRVRQAIDDLGIELCNFTAWRRLPRTAAVPAATD